MIKATTLLWIFSLSLALPLYAVADDNKKQGADYSSFGGANSQQDSLAIWQHTREQYFGNREIIEGARQNHIKLIAPKRAENDAIVPIKITAKSGVLEDKIKKIYLNIDVNPVPMVGVFTLNTERELEQLETRVRVNGYTFIRVIAETTDGKLYGDSQWVKSRGAGCSAPPQVDSGDHEKRLGKMRFRMADLTGNTRQVDLLISHPNNTGMQRDQLSTLFIPQHYVKDIAVYFNDDKLLQAETGFGISENPSFRFNFDADEKGELKAIATDTRNTVFEHSMTIGQ